MVRAGLGNAGGEHESCASPGRAPGDSAASWRRAPRVHHTGGRNAHMSIEDPSPPARALPPGESPPRPAEKPQGCPPPCSRSGKVAHHLPPFVVFEGRCPDGARTYSVARPQSCDRRCGNDRRVPEQLGDGARDPEWPTSPPGAFPRRRFSCWTLDATEPILSRRFRLRFVETRRRSRQAYNRRGP